MVNLNQVASAAYGASQKLGLKGAGEPAQNDGQYDTFAAMVEKGMDRVIDSQHHAEKLSADLVMGKADVNDVIFATQDASMMLETFVALRDKVLQAYQNIMSSAI